MESEDSGKSKFNAAIAKLERIDQIKKDAVNARLSNDYVRWSTCVVCWRVEINGKMNQEERVKADTFEELIEDCLRPRRDYSIASPFIKNKAPRVDGYTAKILLNKYELYLTDIEEHKGIGLINDDDYDGL